MCPSTCTNAISYSESGSTRMPHSTKIHRSMPACLSLPVKTSTPISPAVHAQHRSIPAFDEASLSGIARRCQTHVLPKPQRNLTPRLTDTTGLSSWDTIAKGVKAGGKGQCIEVACLQEGGLGAFRSGPEGHYDIRPLDPQGLLDWLAARAANPAEPDSPYTQFLQSIAKDVWNR